VLSSDTLIYQREDGPSRGEVSRRHATGVVRRWFGILALICLGSCHVAAQTQDTNCTQFTYSEDRDTLTGACDQQSRAGATITSTHIWSGQCYQITDGGISSELLGDSNPPSITLSCNGVCHVNPEPIGVASGPPYDCPPRFLSGGDKHSGEVNCRNFEVDQWVSTGVPAVNVPFGCVPGSLVHARGDGQAVMSCPVTHGTCGGPCPGNPPCPEAQCNTMTKKWYGCPCTGRQPCPDATCDSSTGNWDISKCPQCDPSAWHCDKSTCDYATGKWNNDLCCPSNPPCREAQCLFGQWTGCSPVCVGDPRVPAQSV